MFDGSGRVGNAFHGPRPRTHSTAIERRGQPRGTICPAVKKVHLIHVRHNVHELESGTPPWYNPRQLQDPEA